MTNGMMKRWCAAIALICCCAAQPAAARWLRADTNNFIIYSEGSEKDLRDSDPYLLCQYSGVVVAIGISHDNFIGPENRVDGASRILSASL